MTSADSHPLLQEAKPKSSTLKKVVVAAIALSFVLGSIAGTVANGRGVTSCVQILRRVRAESSRRPPRHRRDACSYRFLTARPSQDGRVIAEK